MKHHKKFYLKIVVASPGLTVQLRWRFYVVEVFSTVQYGWIYKQFFSHKVLGH